MAQAICRWQSYAPLSRRALCVAVRSAEISDRRCALYAGRQKKKDPRGSFSMLRVRALLRVAALASGVARNAAELIIRAERIALVRVARVAILRPVAHALVALLLRRLLRRRRIGNARLTAGHGEVGQRHRRSRQCIPGVWRSGSGETGRRDG